ncbi:ribonuclease S-F11, putative [Entamoeba invadens IP1]|uniref:Ribonuclease S-F11, putative n=1 Tax=Entamoeba invadens IP1 TaxID=370355 RepID=L7FMY8_ENTIV|nr:ribonuclease S-F11, putative [Entamoeba invadens IP1]ELP90965.1 ribonuclease S-F11, putative [Entamoeba invadens IP1]|eukprot:XP_004257736.1 ribonuclease S-F11, putative [Entamoeba invadens IP1]
MKIHKKNNTNFHKQNKEPDQKNLKQKQNQVRKKTSKSKSEQPKQVPFPPKVLKFRFYNYCKKYQNIKKVLSYALVEYWPGEKCRDNVCALPFSTPYVNEGFFLHGLWPQNDAHKNLVCCKTDVHISKAEQIILDDSELKSLIYQNWISVDRCGISIYQFDKHGTCSMKNFVGNNGIVNYIKTAIRLFKKYDLWKILQESDLKVVTNKLYNIDKLRNAIQKVIGNDVIFTCVEMTSIYEIKMCFDPLSVNTPNPKLIKCLDKNYNEEKRRCNTEVMFIHFPDFLLDPVTAPRSDCPY